MEQEVIGRNAGIVWNHLNGKKHVDVARLKKETKLSESEFWAAIGWLSREEKLVFSVEKEGRKTVKYFSLKD